MKLKLPILQFCFLRSSKTIGHRMVELEEMDIASSCCAGKGAEACKAHILPDDGSDPVRLEPMLSDPKPLNQRVS